MTLVVPFDGSELARAALVRAAQFGELLEENVLGVSVVPRGNATYARDRGWLEPGEAFDEATIVSRLRASVRELHPSAEFHHLPVDRAAPHGTIANKLRNFARNHDAGIVFLGSENAGRVVAGMSVGRSVTADPAYDTMIIPAARPSKAEKLEAAKPTRETL